MIKSDGYFNGLVRASSETKLQPITTTHGCICPKNHRIQIQNHLFAKKALELPNVRKDRKVRYLRHEPSMHYKTSNCIGSSRYSVNIKLPGAVFKF